jgi:hypothetical protein
MGCAAPLTLAAGAPWATLTGNQMGALLTDFVLERTSGLTPDHYLVKTLVTTEMIRRIGDSYGVRTYGDLLVGFKWIGGLMDEKSDPTGSSWVWRSPTVTWGPVRAGQGRRAGLHVDGRGWRRRPRRPAKSVHEKLDDLYWQHGYHAEAQVNLFMEGSEGMSRMMALMQLVREQPPRQPGRDRRGRRPRLRQLASGGRPAAPSNRSKARPAIW